MRVFLLAAATLAANPAHPADPPSTPAVSTPPFIVRVLPSGRDIAIAGPITKGLAEAFRAALVQAPDAHLVRLESGGGTLDVAIDLYAAIRSRGMDTAVQAECQSACTVAFMAGTRRFAAPRAKLGFHRAAGEDRPEFPVADFIIRGLYVQSGMAEWFADRVMDTPHETMWRPPLEELRRAGVVTDVGIPP
jgi:hypothetical protein